jgi:hypothetical protein
MVPMRKALLLFVVLGLAGSGWAADPIIGTWKLNIAKSKFPSTQLTLKEQTEVYRGIGNGQIELTYTSVNKDGASTLEVFIFPAQGGTADVVKGAVAGRSYVETKIGPNEWYATCLENGKQVFVLHKVFGKDGKTYTKTSRSLDEQGNSLEYFLVLEKQ